MRGRPGNPAYGPDARFDRLFSLDPCKNAARWPGGRPRGRTNGWLACFPDIAFDGHNRIARWVGDGGWREEY